MKTKNQYISPQTIIMDITATYVFMVTSPAGDGPTTTPSGNVDPSATDYIIGG